MLKKIAAALALCLFFGGCAPSIRPVRPATPQLWAQLGSPGSLDLANRLALPIDRYDEQQGVRVTVVEGYSDGRYLLLALQVTDLTGDDFARFGNIPNSLLFRKAGRVPAHGEEAPFLYDVTVNRHSVSVEDHSIYLSCRLQLFGGADPAAMADSINFRLRLEDLQGQGGAEKQLTARWEIPVQINPAALAETFPLEETFVIPLTQSHGAEPLQVPLTIHQVLVSPMGLWIKGETPDALALLEGCEAPKVTICQRDGVAAQSNGTGITLGDDGTYELLIAFRTYIDPAQVEELSLANVTIPLRG